jgi:predicted AAA+ superfamily ATPase
MPRLLSILAARSASLVNKAELSRATGLPYTTLERYLALFEVTFLYEPVPAWAANLSKRLVRSPKAALLDSGLAGHLTGASLEGRAGEAGAWGGLAETFVVGELRAQASWSDPGVTVSHFRSAPGGLPRDALRLDRARHTGLGSYR